MPVMTMTPFDVTNPTVRQVITPDGIGELAFRDKDDPNAFYIKIRLNGRKIADYRKYNAEDLQEVEK
jgi:hypothetical protein